jgi:SEC-C motif-containing protein
MNSGDNKQCACGSGQSYAICCARFHVGADKAPTAEALMRSRYCAYVEGEIDYLVATTLPAVRRTDLWVDYQATHKTIDWVGLEILSTSQGGEGDKTGKVEFRATYIQEGQKSVHHELSRFRRYRGDWNYMDGDIRAAAIS